MRYKLYVVYDLNEHDFGSLDKKIREAVGKYSDGSGAGFGERDIDWSFDTEKEMTAALARVIGLRLKHCQASTDIYEDED